MFFFMPCKLVFSSLKTKLSKQFIDFRAAFFSGESYKNFTLRIGEDFFIVCYHNNTRYFKMVYILSLTSVTITNKRLRSWSQ